MAIWHVQSEEAANPAKPEYWSTNASELHLCDGAAAPLPAIIIVPCANHRKGSRILQQYHSRCWVGIACLRNSMLRWEVQQTGVLPAQVYP
jgi:hypothetical protein